jgi:hypothetical protein
MDEEETYKRFPQGSVWRKWDLQVQTRLDSGYSCLGNSLENEKLQQLINATGLTEAEIKSQEKSMGGKYPFLKTACTQVLNVALRKKLVAS